MLEIFFESEKEAHLFYTWLNSMKEKAGVLIRQGQTMSVQIVLPADEKALVRFLVPAVADYIAGNMEDALIVSIMGTQFYFTDEDEQQQILSIAHSIMEGERTEIPNLRGFSDKKACIEEALLDFIKPDLKFSFKSFILFRLQNYLQRLKNYVEAAIEEYKLEQEYQSFIQLLRDYLHQKHAVMPEIHVFHRRHFLLFNEDYSELTDSELRRMTDRELLYHHPVYIDTALLAPLVSIAPKRICVYSDDPDHGMIQTIQNVFQERVILHPEVSFYLNSKKIP
ncbi:putative sporulation protein YtxC [Bacillus sp. FJAT-42376]|uniref:putative sporulation protein YtxC n=1 Tax=Bacillus sp. FJAT-42376 TaxID=2014076 RepID=UPI0013DE2B18|nr:putative sporulation protein YtxC [Bacillus sp. FJAT-42376]